MSGAKIIQKKEMPIVESTTRHPKKEKNGVEITLRQRNIKTTRSNTG